MLNDGSHSIDPKTFHKIVGALQYLSVTHPDVSFAVNRLAKFMHQPTVIHLKALKRVLRYLKNTIHYGLYLSRGKPFVLTTFSDLDWGGCKELGRSTTGYAIYLRRNFIS